MRKPFLIALAFSALPSAAYAAPAKNTAPKEDFSYFYSAEMKAAMAVVQPCEDNSRIVRPAVEICKGEWRGVKYVLYSNWNGQIITPSGMRFGFRCSYDAIESSESCSLSNEHQFVIIQSPGYATLINWGFRRYPGSEMVARFDDEAPISTSEETWTNKESRMLYRKMLNGKLMRLRWFDWPNKYSQDSTIDLTGFKDFLGLFEALRSSYTVARVLKKVDVPQ